MACIPNLHGQGPKMVHTFSGVYLLLLSLKMKKIEKNPYSSLKKKMFLLNTDSHIHTVCRLTVLVQVFAST